MRFNIYILLAFLFTTTALQAQIQQPVIGQCPADQEVKEIYIQETVVPPIPPVDPPANPPATVPDVRGIFWVHGLNGNEGSWGPAAAGVKDKFHVSNVLIEYAAAQTGGITSSVDVVNTGLVGGVDKMKDENADLDKTILIGHSLGGVVARLAAQEIHPDLRKFKAIVTVGTSHHGALILNNIEQIKPFGSMACNAMSTKTLQEIFNDKPIVEVVAGKALREMVTSFCSAKNNSGLSKAIESFTSKNYSERMQRELAYNSELIQKMNETGHEGMKHNIAFYSKEDNPEFYRLLYHLLNAPTEEDSWQANDDTAYIDSVYNKWLPQFHSWNKLISRKLDFLEVLGVYPGGWWKNPLGIVARTKKYQKLVKDHQAIKESIDFFERAPALWADIIGTKTIIQGEAPTSYECRCTYYPPGSMTPITVEHTVTDPSQCNFPNAIDCQLTPNYEKVITFERESNSDGVVTVSSQMGFKGAVSIEKMELGDEYNPITKKYEEATPSNHMQERNSLSTKKTLFKLLRGGYDKWYETPEKP